MMIDQNDLLYAKYDFVIDTSIEKIWLFLTEIKV